MTPMLLSLLLATGTIDAPPSSASTQQPTSPSKHDTDNETPSPETTSPLATETGRHLVTIAYNLSIPLWTTRRFVSEPSVEGFGFSYRFRLTSRVAAGPYISWNAFHDKHKGNFEYGNTRITGTRVKTIGTMPLGTSLHYEFVKYGRKAIPFVGLGTGASYVQRTYDYGYWRHSDSEWKFHLIPEIGIRLWGMVVPVHLAIRYHHTFARGDSPDASFVTAAIGITISR